MNAADCLLKCLEINGINAIYGVPGEENADVMIALLESPIKFITCRHEQTSAFMADMHGRMTGVPGVCLATLGPGVTNLLTGVANANMDRVPLIAIIGQADTARLHKESHQNMNAISMCEPISKWAVTIRDPAHIPEIVAKAFKLATTGKPGAVVIELPEDLANKQVSTQPIQVMPLHHESGANRYQADEVVKIIEQAKSPLLLVGAGCIRANASDELNLLIEKTGMYVAHTFMAKGVVSAHHEQSLRCVGLGIKDIVMEAFEMSDCVICVGYDMVEWHPEHWNNVCDKTIINIDSGAAEIDRYFIPKKELIGGIKSTLMILNEQLSAFTKKEYPEMKRVRSAVYQDLDHYQTDDSFPIKPQKVLADIREVLGDKDVLVSDVGAHKMWAARHYPTHLPKTCFIHNGFCSMGGAMPGAAEVVRLNPATCAVALCGDGGFIMSIQALSTAATYNLPIVVVLLEDAHYGLIKWKQDVAFHKSSHTELDNPDFVKLSESFGCYAKKISTPEEFSRELMAAKGRKNQPSVLVVPIDYDENLKLNKHLGDVISH